VIYLIIVLDKLKIVENTPTKMKKIKIKRLWLRLWGPSEIHMPLLGSPRAIRKTFKVDISRNREK
jgi:hypothetical protein